MMIELTKILIAAALCGFAPASAGHEHSRGKDCTAEAEATVDSGVSRTLFQSQRQMLLP